MTLKITDFVDPKQMAMVPRHVREAFIRYLATDPNPAQVMEIVGFYFDRKSHERNFDLDEGKQELLKRLNGDTKMMERKLANVTRALNQEHISDELITLIEESGIGNDPEFILHLDTVGAEVRQVDTEAQQDSQRKQEGDEAAKKLEAEAKDPRAQAQAKIDAIRNDPSHPYHQGNQKAQDEMASLYRILHGDAVHFDHTAPQVLPGVAEKESYESNRVGMTPGLKGVDVQVGQKTLYGVVAGDTTKASTPTTEEE